MLKELGIVIILKGINTLNGHKYLVALCVLEF